MPIYVFRCTGGHDFEQLVPMNSEVPDCPSCGLAARKMPTTFSIGSGRALASKAPGSFSPSSLWQEAFKNKPEKIKREVEFRQQLVAKGIRESPRPDRDLPSGVLLD